MTDNERAALKLINASRRERGLNALKPNRFLSRYARRHSRKMLRSSTLEHGDLMHVLRNVQWSYWGENVGAAADKAGSVAALHKGFMASPPHKANILGRFKRIGLGFASDGKAVFETQVFLRP